MIKSMTGFGRGQRAIEDGTITVEIKSLNSKQLDMSARVPSIYREKEYEIRSAIGKAMVRGKVDVFVNVERGSSAEASGCGVINADLFADYYRQIQQLSSAVGYDLDREPILNTILRMPEVIQSRVVTVSPQQIQALMEAVAMAIDNMNEFRLTEGRVLMDDLLLRVGSIEALMQQVVPFEGERIDSVRNRLSENLAKIAAMPDSNRLEQEIIYYLEKLDITEEKVRLAQHCKYFREVALETEGVGRKLGFIAQEMGREINTMGSKANHTQIQRIVVQMKDELEKIKEQLLNIL